MSPAEERKRERERGKKGRRERGREGMISLLAGGEMKEEGRVRKKIGEQGEE